MYFVFAVPPPLSPSSFRPLLQLPCLAFPPLSLFAKRVSFRRLSVSTSSSHSILLRLFLPVVLHPLTRLFLEPLSFSFSLSLSSPFLSPLRILSSSFGVLFVRGNLLRLSYREIPMMIIRWKFHADGHPSADTFMLLAVRRFLPRAYCVICPIRSARFELGRGDRLVFNRSYSIVPFHSISTLVTVHHIPSIVIHLFLLVSFIFFLFFLECTNANFYRDSLRPSVSFRFVSWTMFLLFFS